MGVVMMKSNYCYYDQFWCHDKSLLILSQLLTAESDDAQRTLLWVWLELIKPFKYLDQFKNHEYSAIT